MKRMRIRKMARLERWRSWWYRMWMVRGRSMMWICVDVNRRLDHRTEVVLDLGLDWDTQM